MNRLAQAKEWYDGQASRLRALDKLVRDPMALHSPLLSELMADFLPLKKADRIKRIQVERSELHRVALVRYFSAFEADFMDAHLALLRQSRLKLNGGRTGSIEDLRRALPDAISGNLAVLNVLDPAQSLIGFVDNNRFERNQLVHGGFSPRLSVKDPADVYTQLVRVLQHIARELKRTDSATVTHPDGARALQ